MIKNTLLLISLLMSISNSFADNQAALDYCAKVDSWPASRAISEEIKANPQLDESHATTQLLSRKPVIENGKHVNAGAWGPVYIQIIKISIPYKKPKSKYNIELLASSFISAEECSLSEPSHINITQLTEIH